jgi:hypothetical protein
MQETSLEQHRTTYPKFPQWQVMSIMASIVKRTYILGKSTDPVEARILAKKLSYQVMDILRRKGIDVHLHGFDQDTSKVWLYLGNHQAFGIEAFFANALIAPDTRIVLKDALLEVPITWKAMSVVDPIVFVRPAKWLDEKAESRANGKSLIHISREQKNTLNTWWSVLVFPEWTRQRGSSEIWEMKPQLFQGSYSLMADTSSWVEKRQVWVITADTFRTFPFTPEEWRCYGGATRHPIQFWLDIIDIESWEKIIDFWDRVKNIMQWHLRESHALA